MRAGYCYLVGATDTDNGDRGTESLLELVWGDKAVIVSVCARES